MASVSRLPFSLLVLLLTVNGVYSAVDAEREIWSFLKVAISLKPIKPCPSKLVCMHLTSTPTSINFLSRF